MKKHKVKKLVINIIAILMMLTGPFLMILPGPQLISWVGAFMFFYNNIEFFDRFLWSKYLMCYIEFRIDRIKKRFKNDKNKCNKDNA